MGWRGSNTTDVKMSRTHGVQKQGTRSLISHLHLGDFADALIQSHLQSFSHTYTHRRLVRSSQGEGVPGVSLRGHLDTQLGGAGGSNQQSSGHQPSCSTSGATDALIVDRFILSQIDF